MRFKSSRSVQPEIFMALLGRNISGTPMKNGGAQPAEGFYDLLFILIPDPVRERDHRIR